MRKLIYFTFTAIIAVLLTGCSLFSPVKSISKSYMLCATPHPFHFYNSKAITIFVTQPQTAHAYNTTQMVYIPKHYQLAYFAKNNWADTPSHMLLPLIVKTLQNTHYFYAVVQPPFTGQYDYLLSTHVVRLQQEFICRPSRIHMTLSAQLINAKSGRVIATHSFSATQIAPCDNPYGGVVAANHASAVILQKLANFCVDNIERR